MRFNRINWPAMAILLAFPQSNIFTLHHCSNSMCILVQFRIFVNANMIVRTITDKSTLNNILK